jgi:CheY-like chemotaxis protein
MSASPKILVVDDEPAIRDLLVAVLEDEGYRTVAASSAPRALELLSAEQPNLVLMDIMMPEMDGREAFRRMEEQPELARIPVVMMSAAYAADRVPGRVAAFLPKPFDLEQLLATIARVLRGINGGGVPSIP